jgi:hypothetical protein
MNSPNESSLSMVSADTRNRHSTQLSGSWLILARGICVALSCFSLPVFFANLPGYFARLQLVCDGSDCGYWQFITPTSVQRLQQVGLTVQGYAIFSVALGVISVLVWSVVGAIIAWRKSNDWMALLVAVGLTFLLLPPNQIGLSIMIFKPIATLILLFAPLCFAIAILRYHLWDIDILIRRTLVYGTLSGILALVYGGSIIFLQYLLRGIIQQDNEVAIVISTLVIAVLFQPLRHRIQGSIDRRFYRRKYDATRTVADFSATLRHEVNLDQLREELVAVVQETMQPSHVSLWLRPTAPGKKHQETEISTSLS